MIVTRRTFIGTGLAAGGLLLLPGGRLPAFAASDPEFLTLLGGGQGGAWYLGAAAMGELAKEIWPGVSTTVTSGGGMSNLRNLAQKKVEFAYAFAMDATAAYRGTLDFEGRRIDGLRAIMSTNPAYVTTVAKPGIDTYRDLAGKSVAPGRAGFTGLKTFRYIAQEAGIADAVKEVNSDYPEMPSMFKDGVVQAATVIGSIPHPTIDEILSTAEGQLVSIDDDIAAALSEKYNYERVVIPAGTFRGQDRDVPTIGSVTQVLTHAEVPDDWVYKLTKASWENRQRLVQAHKAYAELDEKMVLMGVRIPLHPGAERFWREAGILSS